VINTAIIDLASPGYQAPDGNRFDWHDEAGALFCIDMLFLEPDRFDVSESVPKSNR
jgi:hypothetical protein